MRTQVKCSNCSIIQSIKLMYSHNLPKHRALSSMSSECRWQSLRTSDLKLSYIMQYAVSVIKLSLHIFSFVKVMNEIVMMTEDL